jgi:hypothetical protein
LNIQFAAFLKIRFVFSFPGKLNQKQHKIDDK